MEFSIHPHKWGDLVFMCLLTSRQVLHSYMTVYSIHSTVCHVNLCFPLAHPGRSQRLPDKQSYIEIFNGSQRQERGVNAGCLGVKDGHKDEDEGGWRRGKWKRGTQKDSKVKKRKNTREKTMREMMEEQPNLHPDSRRFLLCRIFVSFLTSRALSSPESFLVCWFSLSTRSSDPHTTTMSLEISTGDCYHMALSALWSGGVVAKAS